MRRGYQAALDTVAETNRRYVLVAITLGSFLNPFMGSSIGVALPALGREFRMDAVLLGWVSAAYLIAGSVSLVPSGRLADMYGRKKVFTYGILLSTVASLLAGLSTSGLMLIAFRFVAGVGGAMSVGTGMAILISAFPAGERGRVLGVNVASVYTGLSLGPTVGGLLTQSLGWRSVFLVNVPLGLIVVALVLWKLKGDWATARGESFDSPGFLIYGVTIVSIMLGFSRLPAMSGAVLISMGALALVGFVWWELRVNSPILNINLFRKNTVFALSNLSALINYSATFAITFLLSLYLQYVRGFSPVQAGLVLVAQPVVQAVFSPLAGRLSDKIEPRLISSAGMALIVVGLVLFAFLGGGTSLAFIVASLVFLGFGTALFSSPNSNAIMSSVENRYYGVASATLATMRQVGMMFSMGIVMMLFTLYMGRVEIVPEYHALFLKSMRTAFATFALLCLMGVFASLARGKVKEG